MILGLRSDQIPSGMYASMRRTADELEQHGFHMRIVAGPVSPPHSWEQHGFQPRQDGLIFCVYWHQSIYSPELMDADWCEYITSGLVPTEARTVKDSHGRDITIFIVNHGTTDLPVED